MRHADPEISPYRWQLQCLMALCQNVIQLFCFDILPTKTEAFSFVYSCERCFQARGFEKLENWIHTNSC